MTTLPVFETPRLRLRGLSLEDAPGLHQAYGDPESVRFWDFGPLRTVEETAHRIDRVLQIGTEWIGAWAILLREDERFVGMVNYHHREAWNHRLEIGYILVPGYAGRGLMREALMPFIDHCFAALDTNRIEATIDPENVASMRLAESLGFRREAGLMRERWLVDGRFRSRYMYGLLRREWPPG